MGLFGAFSEFALHPSSLKVQEKRRERKIERYIYVRRTHSRVCAICAECTQIHSYVCIVAKSHPCPTSSLFKLFLSLTQNFPLTSNSRIDDFYFVRFLSLSSFFVFSLLHTIIAFVPLRSSVVLNFHIPTPRRKKREKKEKRTPIDSSSQLKRGNAACTKKGPSQKKGLRARVSSGVQLIEVHLCARPAARRSESAVCSGQRRLRGCPRCVLPSLFFWELLASTNFG